MKVQKLLIVIIIFILLSGVVYAESNIVYSLKLKYDGNALSNEDLKLIEGIAPQRLDQPETGFTLKVIDFNGNVIHFFKFPIETVPFQEAPRDIFSEDGTQIAYPKDSPMIPKNTEIVMIVPYFDNGKSIDIYNENNQLVLSVDISKYSKKKVPTSNNLGNAPNNENYNSVDYGGTKSTPGFQFIYNVIGIILMSIIIRKNYLNRKLQFLLL